MPKAIIMRVSCYIQTKVNSNLKFDISVALFVP